ncbi:actin cortical patch SUR7/pH-response regulator pali [Gautieria morchelliformis]|nr:actin cortical patch SUR7/pH-response regulator pali [Gautieria morchelliformis]
MARTVSFLLPLCLFVCFTLLLLVSLSMPIIKALYIVAVRAEGLETQPATAVATELRFGVWGYCANSVLNLSTIFTDGECTPAHLGYRIDPAIMALAGHAAVAQDIEKALTIVFVLHPVATGLTLLALICAIPASRSRCCGIVTLIIEVISALLTTVVLAVDFTLIDELEDRIGGSFDVDFGNCPWIVLGATLLIWISVAMSSAVACKCCGCGRRRDRDW